MPYNSWNTPAMQYYYGNNQYMQQNGQQYAPNYAQMQQAQAQQQAQMQPTAQIQNGGFVSVPNIDVARNWAVAPGNSVTFKDESAPYIYTKTMGYNQLDTPRFERFRLVKEEDAQTYDTPKTAPETPSVELSSYALKSDLDSVQAELEALKQKLEEIADKKQAIKPKKEEKADA